MPQELEWGWDIRESIVPIAQELETLNGTIAQNAGRADELITRRKDTATSYIAVRKSRRMLSDMVNAGQELPEEIRGLIRISGGNELDAAGMLQRCERNLNDIRYGHQEYRRRIREANTIDPQNTARAARLRQRLAQLSMTPVLRQEIDRNEIHLALMEHPNVAKVTTWKYRTYFNIGVHLYNMVMHGQDENGEDKDIYLGDMYLEFKYKPEQKAPTQVSCLAELMIHGLDDNDMPHPHWISAHNPCLGDFGGPVAECNDNLDIVGAIQIYIMFLQQWYQSDAAGRYAHRWDRDRYCYKAETDYDDEKEEIIITQFGTGTQRPAWHWEYQDLNAVAANSENRSYYLQTTAPHYQQWWDGIAAALEYEAAAAEEAERQAAQEEADRRAAEEAEAEALEAAIDTIINPPTAPQPVSAENPVYSADGALAVSEENLGHGIVMYTDEAGNSWTNVA